LGVCYAQLSVSNRHTHTAVLENVTECSDSNEDILVIQAECSDSNEDILVIQARSDDQPQQGSPDTERQLCSVGVWDVELNGKIFMEHLMTDVDHN